MPNSQYERDFNDLGALKRPGRLDFKTLNNVDDAGDGHPGLQKAIRNYFHEGYLEKDINMNTHKIINLQAPSGNNDGARKVDVDTVQNDLDGFDDELKSLSSVEVQQLQNIGSVTISNAQWGYLGVLDQSLVQAQSPTFVGLTLSANLVTSSTVDGIDISDIKLNSMPSVADGDINANSQKIINVVDPVDNQDVATKNFVKNYFPIGTILMYKGTGWVDNSTILGWWKCDGANGTPDLVDKFIRSEASSSNEGGSDDAVVVQHNHIASQVSHSHQLKLRSLTRGGDTYSITEPYSAGTLTSGYVGSETPIITVDNEGVSGIGANKPVYYSLIFIMRVS